MSRTCGHRSEQASVEREQSWKLEVGKRSGHIWKKEPREVDETGANERCSIITRGSIVWCLAVLAGSIDRL